MTPEELKRLEELNIKLGSQKWYRGEYADEYGEVFPDDMILCESKYDSDPIEICCVYVDGIYADLMVELRNTIPSLLSHVRELEAENAAIKLKLSNSSATYEHLMGLVSDACSVPCQDISDAAAMLGCLSRMAADGHENATLRSRLERIKRAAREAVSAWNDYASNKDTADYTKAGNLIDDLDGATSGLAAALEDK